MWCLCYREATTAQITNTRKTKGFDVFLSLQQSWWSVPLWSVGNQKLPLIQYVYHLIKSSCCNCLVRTDAVVGDEFLAFAGKPHIHEGWHWITGRCCVGRHLENSQHSVTFLFWQTMTERVSKLPQGCVGQGLSLSALLLFTAVIWGWWTHSVICHSLVNSFDDSVFTELLTLLGILP